MYYSKLNKSRAREHLVSYNAQGDPVTSSPSQPAHPQTVLGHFLEATTDQGLCLSSNLEAATLPEKVRELNHTDVIIL